MPPRVADREIDHLEAVLSLGSRAYATTALPRLDLAYWRSRVEQIGNRYELLPQQKNRVAKLLRALAAVVNEESAAPDNPMSRIAA
jgi:hypothetical protein